MMAQSPTESTRIHTAMDNTYIPPQYDESNTGIRTDPEESM